MFYLDVIIYRRLVKNDSEDTGAAWKSRGGSEKSGFVWTVIGGEVITKCSELHSFIEDEGRRGCFTTPPSSVSPFPLLCLFLTPPSAHVRALISSQFTLDFRDPGPYVMDGAAAEPSVGAMTQKTV